MAIKAPELANTSSTVTAMGVSLCASLGFQEVYLFGVDLGSKEPKHHHPKYSNYCNPKSMLNKIEVGFDKVAPGNFWGKVYTNYLFEETGYAIHKTIYQTGIKVYDPKDNFRKDYAGNIPDTKEPLEDLYKVFLKAEEIVRSLPKQRDLAKAFHQMVIIGRLIQAMESMGITLVFHNTYQWSFLAIGHILKLFQEEALPFTRGFLNLYADFLKEAGQAIKALLEKDYSI